MKTEQFAVFEFHITENGAFQFSKTDIAVLKYTFQKTDIRQICFCTQCTTGLAC